MSTPQDPDGDTPQDPQDPQNPYGTPSPPPPNVPPPAAPVPPPATGIPPAPQAPPTYGAPPAPPYGDPTAPPAATPYGQPAFPAYGAPVTAEPGKGMAIAALISSILGCTCIGALVAIPLAIVVLVRSRDGRNHGKGLAIAALIISVISLIGLAAGGYAVYDYAKDFKSPDDLKAGDCITAKGLSDTSVNSVTEIRTVACSTKHDGEVLATVELSADQAKNSETTQAEDVCTPAIDAAGKLSVITPDMTVTALTVADPDAGDNAACVAYKIDGSKLTGKLGS
jgi:Domain of unknown function (DUF4190)